MICPQVSSSILYTTPLSSVIIILQLIITLMLMSLVLFSAADFSDSMINLEQAIFNKLTGRQLNLSLYISLSLIGLNPSETEVLTLVFLNNQRNLLLLYYSSSYRSTI